MLILLYFSVSKIFNAGLLLPLLHLFIFCMFPKLQCIQPSTDGTNLTLEVNTFLNIKMQELAVPQSKH